MICKSQLQNNLMNHAKDIFWFQNHITPNKNDLVTYADEMIGMLSWLYDLIFNESFKILDFYGYFEKIVSGIGKLEGVSKEELCIIRGNIDELRQRK